MTTTTNGHRVSDTFSDDVQMCVRAPETPGVASEAPDRGRKSAYTRAIPERAEKIKGSAVEGLRNFASQHAADAAGSVKGSWPLTESPQPVAAVARAVFPAKGEAPNVVAWVGMSIAGAVRLAVHATAQLVQLAVATRIRAGVALVLFVAVVAAGWIRTHI